MSETVGSRVALVTGSATGIGRATALLLAQRGLAVAVNYSRSEKEAKETLEEVKRHGVPAITVQQTQMRQAASPEQIAEVVAFLALDASLVTGQVLIVDGGRTM
jgi:3-oxoacyl-[acyl-carrier protein] reductase